MLPGDARTQIRPPDETLLVDLSSEQKMLWHDGFSGQNPLVLPLHFSCYFSPRPASTMTLDKTLFPGAANAWSDSSSLGHISDASPKLLRANADPHQGAPGSSSLSCAAVGAERSWAAHRRADGSHCSSVHTPIVLGEVVLQFTRGPASLVVHASQHW